MCAFEDGGIAGGELFGCFLFPDILVSMLFSLGFDIFCLLQDRIFHEEKGEAGLLAYLRHWVVRRCGGLAIPRVDVPV